MIEHAATARAAPGETTPNRRLLLPALSLLTFAIITFELALTRIFSATLYYHFAFVAISLALFGSGASGVFIYLFGPRPTPAEAPRWLGGASTLFGVGAVVALLVLLANPVSLEGGASNYARLSLIYCVAAIPFFLGGCAVTLAIAVFRADAGRVYFFDLLGAAVGSLALIPALESLGAIDTIFATATLGALAGVLFTLSPPPERLRATGSPASLPSAWPACSRSTWPRAPSTSRPARARRSVTSSSRSGTPSRESRSSAAWRIATSRS